MKPGNESIEKLVLRKAKQAHNESIKNGCQCGFRVEQSYVTPNLGLLHYYYMEHVDS